MSAAASRSAVDLLPDAVLQLDNRRTIAAANPAAVALTGYGSDELIGRDCGDLLDPRDPGGRPVWGSGWHPSAQLRSVRALPEQQVDVRRRDATTTRTLVTGRYLRDAAGCLLGLVLVLRRSSDRTHRAANGIDIVTAVSHELRSPLASVKGYTGLLLSRWDSIPDDQKREMLEQVEHDADRVARLIGELLDVARLETGRLVLRRRMIDLAAVAAAVVVEVRCSHPALEATVDIPDHLPRVYADPDKVRQVLANLVENACKYASPRGITIRAGAGADDVAVEVIDQGAGIGAGELPLVFTKFFRRDLARPTGTGLGLWIARGLIEAHGGRLTATSVVGRGSTFRLTLPLHAFEALHER